MHWYNFTRNWDLILSSSPGECLWAFTPYKPLTGSNLSNIPPYSLLKIRKISKRRKKSKRKRREKKIKKFHPRPRPPSRIGVGAHRAPCSLLWEAVVSIYRYWSLQTPPSVEPIRPHYQLSTIGLSRARGPPTIPRYSQSPSNTSTILRVYSLKLLSHSH